MKFIIVAFISTFLTINNSAVADSDKFFTTDRSLFDIFSGKKKESSAVKIKKLPKIKTNSDKFFSTDRGLFDILSGKKKQSSEVKGKKIKKSEKIKTNSDKFFTTDSGLFDIFSDKKIASGAEKTKQAKRNANLNNSLSYKDDNPQNISFYTGTFDTIDEEGDDKTTLLGIEHKNKDLFRNTWIGRFSPTTGAFVTKKSSIYLYTGIEADYNLGPINISPSFAPGYYDAGNGKNLGSALEFKSEIKIGVDLFKNTNLGYSYSHISNNDWGDVNPGSDNQSVIFSKKY